MIGKLKELLGLKRPLCCIVNRIDSRGALPQMPWTKMMYMNKGCCEAVDRCIDHHAPGCWRRINHNK